MITIRRPAVPGTWWPPRGWRLWATVAATVAVVLAVSLPLALRERGSIQLHGLAEGALVSEAGLAELAVTVAATGVDGAALRARVGEAALPVEQVDGSYVVRLGGLPDGNHELVVSAGDDGVEARRRFTVDTTPPEVELQLPAEPVGLGDPVTVTLTTEPDATVEAEGGQVGQPSEPGGPVEIRYRQPPVDAPVTVTDRAGNHTIETVTVPTRYPAEVRGVHLTGYAWATKSYREGALRLIEEERINAVQIDIKEEDGIVNMAMDVPLANEIDAVVEKYDPAEMTETLHDLGVRIIGRVVVFYDPVLADWAWRNGERDWAVQSAGGGPYSSNYGEAAFTNFANEEVWQYNIDVAVAAVEAGVDDIVFDYIRRPEGGLSRMKFAGLDGRDPERVIAEFAETARATLRPLGANTGAALFGQAVKVPDDTAQNVPMMAEHLDMVMPMVYPNHWANGEYGVDNPAREPYKIIRRSLADWAEAVEGTDCVVVPWLWASDVLDNYTPAMVEAQIRGARENDMPGWLMWNALARYEKYASALSPDAEPVL